MRFFEALINEQKNPALPEKYNYFGQLIGSWKVEYIDTATSRSIKGEWHFAWVLDGMAIQDVIVLPDYECGTTLRVYNPHTNDWDVAYCFAGKIMRLVAKKQDSMIVLRHLDNEKRKWVFVNIEDNKFHWQDGTIQENGEWHIDFEIYAERI